MEDKSEPLEGDRDRLLGKVIGPRYWFTLGGFVGGGENLMGLRFLGILREC